MQKSASVVRWAARIIGLPVTLAIFLLMGIENVRMIFMRLPKGPPNMPVHIPVTAQIIIAIVFAALVSGAYVTSWWKERIGGMLFVFASIFVIGWQIALFIGNSRVYQVPGFQGSMSNIGSWFIMWVWTGGLPLLLVGILFLIAVRLSKKPVISPELQSNVTADI